MKPFIVVTLCSMLSAPMLFSQSGSINNTLGSSGIFTIKDGSTTFLTLSQSTGYLGLNKSLTLPLTTDATLGVIFKGADRFIHDFEVTGTSGSNTFVGVNSGNFTMSGFDPHEASNNTAVGHSSLTSLTDGFYNSAFGSQSLFSNTTGYANSAFGENSLYNTTGSENSAFGSGSLYENTTGSENSAFGSGSLYNNTGQQNSAFGWSAGNSITTGSNNIAIGYNAQVAVGTNSNQIRIGNASITLATTQVAWTFPSDRRWKSNIVHSDLGLDFIAHLRPASYTRKNDERQRVEYGFIAQEIEEILEEAGVENTGMLTIDDAGMYQLRYNDLLAPMVKAIQELKRENDVLVKKMAEHVEEDVQKREVAMLKSENEALQQRLVKLESLFSSVENKFTAR